MRLKARSEALKDRIAIINQYLSRLIILHNTFETKEVDYAAKIAEGDKFNQETSKLSASYVPTLEMTDGSR